MEDRLNDCKAQMLNMISCLILRRNGGLSLGTDHLTRVNSQAGNASPPYN